MVGDAHELSYLQVSLVFVALARCSTRPLLFHFSNASLTSSFLFSFQIRPRSPLHHSSTQPNRYNPPFPNLDSHSS